MAEKAHAQSSAFMRALDQSRQIGHDECAAQFAAFFTGAAVSVHHTQIWFQRRKWIVRDLGPCRGNHRNQCRFSGVGESHQTDVG